MRSGLGSPSFRGLLRLGFCFLQRCAGFGGVMLPVGLELHGTKNITLILAVPDAPWNPLLLAHELGRMM